MKGIIALTLFLLSGIAAAALDNEKQLYDIASKAMAEVDKKNFSAAVEVLRPHMPLPKHEIDGLIYQIQQQAPTSETIGDRPRFSACDMIFITIRRQSRMVAYAKKASSSAARHTFTSHPAW